jgi:hypothetical protein
VIFVAIGDDFRRITRILARATRGHCLKLAVRGLRYLDFLMHPLS